MVYHGWVVNISPRLDALLALWTLIQNTLRFFCEMLISTRRFESSVAQGKGMKIFDCHVVPRVRVNGHFDCCSAILRLQGIWPIFRLTPSPRVKTHHGTLQLRQITGPLHYDKAVPGIEPPPPQLLILILHHHFYITIGTNFHEKWLITRSIPRNITSGSTIQFLTFFTDIFTERFWAKSISRIICWVFRNVAAF